MSKILYAVSVAVAFLGSGTAVLGADAKPAPQPLWPDGRREPRAKRRQTYRQ